MELLKPAEGTVFETAKGSRGYAVSADVVLAFQDGGYEQGSRASVSAVPEPSITVLAALAAMLTASITRRKPPRGALVELHPRTTGRNRCHSASSVGSC
jgi:hypothetical protein